MADITAEHLHHMARRHHAVMQKVVVIQERFATVTTRSLGTLQTGAGAWLGGIMEGRTGGKSIGPIPLNLGTGLALLGVGAMLRSDTLGAMGGPGIDMLTQLGNGFVGSYLAAAGFAFGKRWKETGKMFGGGGHPWSQPYENGWSQASSPS